MYIIGNNIRAIPFKNRGLSVNQQTQDIDPYVVLLLAYRLRRWPNIKTTLGQCLAFVGRTVLANTKHLYNICTTSAQRLRRWSNIVQMLYKGLCLLGCDVIRVGPTIQGLL